MKFKKSSFGILLTFIKRGNFKLVGIDSKFTIFKMENFLIIRKYNQFWHCFDSKNWKAGAKWRKRSGDEKFCKKYWSSPKKAVDCYLRRPLISFRSRQMQSGGWTSKTLRARFVEKGVDKKILNILFMETSRIGKSTTTFKSSKLLFKFKNRTKRKINSEN